MNVRFVVLSEATVAPASFRRPGRRLPARWLSLRRSTGREFVRRMVGARRRARQSSPGLCPGKCGARKRQARRRSLPNVDRRFLLPGVTLWRIGIPVRVESRRTRQSSDQLRSGGVPGLLSRRKAPCNQRGAFSFSPGTFRSVLTTPRFFKRSREKARETIRAVRTASSMTKC